MAANTGFERVERCFFVLLLFLAPVCPSGQGKRVNAGRSERSIATPQLCSGGAFLEMKITDMQRESPSTVR